MQEMNPNDENSRIETIERFCLGKMTSEELAEFKAMQVENPTLLQEIADYQAVLTMIKKVATENQVVNTLARLEVEEPIMVQPISLRNPKYFWRNKVKIIVSLASAACLIFVLYASLSAVQLPGSENDLTIVRDIDPSVLSPIQKSAFDHFFAGQSHISEGQFKAAVLDFEEVLKIPNLRPYFEQATQWHLVVAQLKSGEIDKAKQQYQKLTNCNECVYPIGFMNKSKLWWQIFWADLF
jgi:hypothetical protein